MPHNTLQTKLDSFARLLKIMDELRELCPWDKKQTLESLRSLTIEETYELGDAILNDDLKGIKEELGDVMLHMVFYAKIGDEKGSFDIADALNGVCDKLIARHPHIYSDWVVKDEEEVKRNWEKLKIKEGKKSALEGVPIGLPAIVKAYRIQEKAAKTGFDWDNAAQVWEKVEEEIAELHEAVLEIPDKKEEEFGDVLFSLINYARFINIDPETALERTNRKFIRRYEFVETHGDKRIEDMTLDEMNALWDKAKLTEK